MILLDIDSEAQLFQNVLDEMHAPESAVIIGGSAFELKANVVFPGPFADQRLNR